VDNPIDNLHVASN